MSFEYLFHQYFLHLQYQQILMVMEMAEEPPDIRFDTIEHWGGVEVIEKARRQG